jgi:2-polyprenyl-6-methoxyphenol hydroxylase-like FAD-dependent oxidoreductase
MKQDADYDIVVVGGGIAGSTLARVLAERSLRVLVLERENRFKDRIRGEVVLPWGVPDARNLGVYELLTTTCGHEIRWLLLYTDGTVSDQRDLVATTPHQSGFVTFYHPQMQTVLLTAAEAAGAEVRRNTKVTGVIPGEPAAVLLDNGDRVCARLVVGADGRRSNVRMSSGFEVKHDPEWMITAGVLLEHIDLDEDAVHIVVNSSIGQNVFVFPLGRQRFRCYFIYGRRDQYPWLSGSQRLPKFVDACIETGAPPAWFTDAQAVGPLAAFEGADSWVDHPYQEGVVLIGDAAAASDPIWGWGMALTLRDVRILRDHLLATDDWVAAAEAYAREHDRVYEVTHRLEAWATDLTFTTGVEADTRRSRVFECQRAEPDRVIDMLGIGPDSPNDKITRSQFFAEN